MKETSAKGVFKTNANASKPEEKATNSAWLKMCFFTAISIAISAVGGAEFSRRLNDNTVSIDSSYSVPSKPYIWIKSRFMRKLLHSAYLNIFFLKKAQKISILPSKLTLYQINQILKSNEFAQSATLDQRWHSL
jgi:hypothetical protein